jgi:leucyl-tRNA synthetase
MPPLDLRENDAKWQARWEDAGVFRADDDPARPKAYILDMFPYPSGAGLHVGHPEGYTATDIVARLRRMQGVNVLHPMGWDAFGLPAENYAIKHGVHPAKTTAAAIENFRRQIKAIGLSYDWSREVTTCDPSYYRWTQWIFLRLWERGLAYQANVPINWCPSCRTGLANEEVQAGRCERCGAEVERRDMRQWLLKITAYADRLLEDLAEVDWPESTLAMQRNWIGRSQGAEIDFPTWAGPIRVFTTRPDTVFGATAMVLSPEHPLVERLTTDERRAAVEAYRAAARGKSDLERTDLAKEKTGVAIGATATNPANGEPIPVWIADYVLIGYGTGAIMMVPGHDERDHAFARAHGLPIIEVVRGGDVSREAYVGEGVAVNSPPIDGLESAQAKATIIRWLEEKGFGKGAVSYRLRDWIFSRQRYWGEPFPIVHCQGACGGPVPVPDDQLPVRLPDVERYETSGTGESPLAAIRSWVETTCPRCGAPGERETNTMPNWAGSCWYYLRFMDPHNDTAPFSPEKARQWGPVDLYVGGTEHAVLHLLYARFWHKFLFDLGLVHTREPFARLRHQGMVLAFSFKDERGAYRAYEDIDFAVDPPALKDGGALTSMVEKMSKSKANVINPDDVLRRYGADGLRLYEMFMGDFEAAKPWDVRGIEGVARFLARAWRVVDDPRPVDGDPNARARHAAIKAVGERIEAFKFNTAIAALMEYVTVLLQGASREDLEVLCKLLSPFAPHLAEAAWERLGHPPFVCTQAWPTYDPALTVAPSVTVAVQVNGKLRGTFEAARGTPDEELRRAALEVPNVVKHLGDRAPRKIIVVKGELVNVVV